MCAVFEVWPSNLPGGRAVSACSTLIPAFLAEIRQIHHDSGQRYGTPRVRAALRTQGRGASRGRI